MASTFISLPIEAKSTKTLFTQTASVTIADTVTQTSVVSTGVGSVTLPANFFVVGKTVRVTALGFHSSTGSPSVNVRIKVDGVTIATGTVASGNGTDDGFVIEGILTCRSTGVSGTLQGQGRYAELHSSGAQVGLVDLAPETIDTTIANVVDVTFKWNTAAAGNTITCTNVTLEALN